MASTRTRPPSRSRLTRRNALIEAHLHLVDPIARRLARRLPPCFELDDLKSAGMIGLIEAATRFDPARVTYGNAETVFRALAKQRISGAILDSFRRRHYREAMHQALNESLPAAQVLEENVVRKEVARVISINVGRLPDREQHVVRRYYNGHNLASAGAELGVGPSFASKLHRSALRQLQRSLRSYALPEAA